MLFFSHLKRSCVSVIAITLFSMPLAAQSQNITCGEAVSQLQQYVSEVNNFANMEFNQGIPFKCGYNQQCRYTLLQQLNGWYVNQSNLVNGWHQKIVANCSSGTQKSNEGVRRSRPRNSAPTLDEDDVASIDVDKEDKTVRIRIPSTPSGYR